MTLSLAGGRSWANNNHSAPAPSHPAPAPHFNGGGNSGMRPGGMMGSAGAHLPGSMSSGAHIPGSMGGGAHVPSSMGGGAHIPGSMGGGAHIPGSMANGTNTSSSGAHMPNASHGGEQHAVAQPRQNTPHAASDHIHAANATGTEHRGPSGEHGAGEHAQGSREAEDHHEADRHGNDQHAPNDLGKNHRFVGQPNDRPARNDPRIGPAGLHHPGLEAGLAARRFDRPYLRLPEHRDLIRERAFIAFHNHDFHGRFVRDFNWHDRALWRRGLWRDEWHYGRRGWWWDVNGTWYPYGDPIWPYPVEIAEPVVYDTPVVMGPVIAAQDDQAGLPVPDASQIAGAAVQTAEPAAPLPSNTPFETAALIPPLPAAPAGWFRCAEPNGYYPGVDACAESWNLVQDPPSPEAQ